MKALLRLLKWIFYTVLAILAVGCFLPGSARLSRSVDVAAPAAKVFNQINDLKNWNNWSPWFSVDPAAIYAYSQPSAGIGAYFTWESKNPQLGSGKTTILNAVPNQLVHTKTELQNVGEVIGDFKITAPDSARANVVWTYDMDYGANPVMRWMGVFYGDVVAKDYEKGLAQLKRLVEQ